MCIRDSVWLQRKTDVCGHNSSSCWTPSLKSEGSRQHSFCLKSEGSRQHCFCLRSEGSRQHSFCLKTEGSRQHSFCLKSVESSQYSFCLKSEGSSQHSFCLKSEGSRQHSFCLKSVESSQHSFSLKWEDSKQHTFRLKSVQRRSDKRTAARRNCQWSRARNVTGVSYADCHKRSREQFKRENNCGAEKALFRLPRQVRVGKTVGKCHTGVRQLFFLSLFSPPRQVLFTLICYIWQLSSLSLSFLFWEWGCHLLTIEDVYSFLKTTMYTNIKHDLCKRQTEMHANVGHQQ